MKHRCDTSRRVDLARAWLQALAVLLLAAAAPPLTAQGPDVIAGSLHEARSWGTDGSGIYAYSIGTIACNVGDEVVAWQGGNEHHPVIAQNLYRYHEGRFEQIGLSWVKHGVTALQQFYCGGCTAGGSISALGVGCSDPYSGHANGLQTRLGPRSTIDPATGLFPFPIGIPDYDPVIGRRLQVHAEDLDPALNPGAVYIAEAQYIAADDAAAGNADNNASHRYGVVGSAPEFPLTLEGDTQVSVPAIFAWADLDPEVGFSEVTVVNDGKFILGYRVIDDDNGFWEYEYALYNANSARAAGSFSVPLPLSNVIEALGFHDVDHHSGEPHSGVDWSPVRGAIAQTWSTFEWSTDANANALRWGTLYNFRFRTNAPPVLGEVTIGLFTPGTPSSATLAALVPQTATADHLPFVRGDLNHDGGLDIADPLATLSYLFGGQFGPACLDAADSDDSGSIDLADAIHLLSHLFAGGPPPAAPFPTCGPDPTPDLLHCADSACP
ncbi:MAG: hypothetical protein AAF488_08770 [Planctomycetota bacterium]